MPADLSRLSVPSLLESLRMSPSRTLRVLVTATATLTVAALLSAAPGRAAERGDVVEAPARLAAGDRMTSSNGAFTLTVQTDGNVVERRGATAVWTTRTNGNPGAVLDVQTDGNVVVRAANGRAVWTSGTPGHHGQLLALQDSGELVMQSDVNSWSNGVGVPKQRTVLAAGESLRSNSDDSFVYSPRGRFSFYAMLGVHLDESVPAFSIGIWYPRDPAGRAGSEPGVLTLQTDGNLVYRARNGGVIWASGSRGAGVRLTVQDDGNVVIRRPNGAAVWSTGTTRALLGAGEAVGPGTQFVTSANRFGDRSVTTVQADGNVVRRGAGNGVMWTTGTSGNPGARLIMQTDGNMVVRRPDGRAVWQSGTSGCGSRATFDTGQGWIFVGGGDVWAENAGRTGAC